MATALMCRSATELAVYNLVFRSKEKSEGRVVRVGHLTDEQLDEVDKMRWGEILQLAKDLGYVAPDLQARIDSIRSTQTLQRTSVPNSIGNLPDSSSLIQTRQSKIGLPRVMQ